MKKLTYVLVVLYMLSVMGILTAVIVSFWDFLLAIKIASLSFVLMKIFRFLLDAIIKHVQDKLDVIYSDIMRQIRR
jgi:hypothetical protein